MSDREPRAPLCLAGIAIVSYSTSIDARGLGQAAVDRVHKGPQSEP